MHWSTFAKIPEVFVFVDSDVIARPDFLRQLVAPLSGRKRRRDHWISILYRISN